jgi:cytochrome P450
VTAPSASPGDPASLYPPRIVPPARPLGLARFLATFVRNPLRVLPEAVYREPLVQYQGRRILITWVTDPELVKVVLLEKRDSFTKTPVEKRVLGRLLGNGILTSDGPEWRWQRLTAAPLFRPAEVAALVPAMTAAAEGVLDAWRQAAPGTVHRVDLDMTRATFRVITDTMLPGGGILTREVFERANANYLRTISWPIAYALLRLPEWIPYPGRGAMRQAEQRMRLAVHDLVRSRRAEPRQGVDLLAQLMRARNPDTDQPMSDTQLVDNLLTFLLAGHETTARALAWSLYLLARAPEWAQRLAREIDEVAGTAPIDAAHLNRLVLVTRFVKEAMRLYPPAPVLTRIAQDAVELGGVRLGPGSLIVMPVYAIHRHRRLWADPDRFDPDRFLPEREATHSRYQYMPFGAGPRVCIGGAFAMMEATAMLATLVRGARFDIMPGHVPVPVSRVTLRPGGGMPLKVWPRDVRVGNHAA